MRKTEQKADKPEAPSRRAFLRQSFAAAAAAALEAEQLSKAAYATEALKERTIFDKVLKPQYRAVAEKAARFQKHLRSDSIRTLANNPNGGVQIAQELFDKNPAIDTYMLDKGTLERIELSVLDRLVWLVRDREDVIRLHKFNSLNALGSVNTQYLERGSGNGVFGTDGERFLIATNLHVAEGLGCLDPHQHMQKLKSETALDIAFLELSAAAAKKLGYKLESAIRFNATLPQHVEPQGSLRFTMGFDPDRGHNFRGFKTWTGIGMQGGIGILDAATNPVEDTFERGVITRTHMMIAPPGEMQRKPEGIPYVPAGRPADGTSGSSHWILDDKGNLYFDGITMGGIELTSPKRTTYSVALYHSREDVAEALRDPRRRFPLNLD